jgi:hypothetical protein
LANGASRRRVRQGGISIGHPTSTHLATATVHFPAPVIGALGRCASHAMYRKVRHSATHSLPYTSRAQCMAPAESKVAQGLDADWAFVTPAKPNMRTTKISQIQQKQGSDPAHDPRPRQQQQQRQQQHCCFCAEEMLAPSCTCHTDRMMPAAAAATRTIP